MTSRLAVWLLLAAVLAPLSRGTERNAWPLWVAQEDAGGGQANPMQALGPLFHRQTGHDGTVTEAFRPFYLQTTKGPDETTHLLYPLLTWRRRDGSTDFSFFQLVNTRNQAADGARPGTHALDVWPFYFSRHTGDPATSYVALFPIAGTIKQRFGKDRIEWSTFPLWLRTEKDGMQTTSAPWPFVRMIDGAGHKGFELWPLLGERGRAGDYRDRFLLWPLFYRNESHLSAAQPDVKLGALPFYSRETGPGYRSETFVWPFFGYTHRTAPDKYDETRYLWPFLVQGRGDGRIVNRWAPVYTHSVIKGYDKTWILWPLLRHATWQEAGLAQRQDRLLFFLYWSLEQRSLANPAAAPAYKKHLWPLFSMWDNGAGRRQVQFLSPFEVFFPHNGAVRQLYTPLFALWRYDQRARDDVRWSLLWGLLSRSDTPAEKEFHLGPLLSTRSTPDTGSRVAIGGGLFAWRRPPGAARWKFFLFDFRPRPAIKAPPGSTP